MTVTVETPDGIVSASSVIEVEALYFEGGELVSGREVGYTYRGEAVALEVLPGQWLFALIDAPAALMYHASPDQFGGIPRHDRGTWLSQIRRQRTPVELTGGFRPRLVTFADLNDPVTVEAVDPDDLAATFGDGVRLREVTLEVVRQGVGGDEILGLLPWLPDVYSTMLDGSSTNSLYAEHRLANDLTQNHFWRP
ncbi:MAG: hypothetical protein AAF376_04505 [Pseudomonadota bacterium]